MSKQGKSAEQVLRENGATELEGYCLVSNFGYTFKLNGKRYDARYWANCYGAALNRWGVLCLERRRDGSYERIDENLKQKLEAELNASRDR